MTYALLATGFLAAALVAAAVIAPRPRSGSRRGAIAACAGR